MVMNSEGDVRAHDPLRTDSDTSPSGTPEIQLNLLLEGLIEISAIVDQSLDRLQTHKRMRFLVYEAQLALTDCSSEIDRFQNFIRYFFEEKAFRFIDPQIITQFTMRSYHIHHLLVKKWAAHQITKALFCGLAQQLGLNVQMIKTSERLYAKWFSSGDKVIIDLFRNGVELSSDEIVELVKFNEVGEIDVWKDLKNEDLLFEVVEHMKQQLQQYPAAGLLKRFQQMQIVLRPQNVELLAERAIISYRLGDETGALRDLKKYFAQQSKDRGSKEVVDLYNELSQKHPQVSLFD